MPVAELARRCRTSPDGDLHECELAGDVNRRSTTRWPGPHRRGRRARTPGGGGDHGGGAERPLHRRRCKRPLLLSSTLIRRETRRRGGRRGPRHAAIYLGERRPPSPSSTRIAASVGGMAARVGEEGANPRKIGGGGNRNEEKSEAPL